MTSTITRLVLAITSKETRETLERWQFDITTEDTPGPAGNASSSSSSEPQEKEKPKKEKTEKEVQAEIRDIMKQITASVTFLPMLEEECELFCSSLMWLFKVKLILKLDDGHQLYLLGSFTLLAYTSTQDPLPLPETWNDADPHLIDKGKVEQVRLRSFSTNVHKMEAMVAYKVGE